jgi:hypothetical protein
MVVATDTFETIAELVRRLVAQTVAAELELVVVCPSAEALRTMAAFEGLGRVQVVEQPLLPIGEARAAGVRAATAPIVAIGETHAYPAPDWAEAVLRAHEAPWAVVVPAVANGNPEGGVLSWSALLIDYGRWSPARIAGETRDPPTYNAVFKRKALLEFEDRLGPLLDPGSTLARELYERGGRAYHEPAAAIEHLNVARPRDWLHERYLGGRWLAGARRARWRRWRSLVYLFGSPLVPVVLLLRARIGVGFAAAATGPVRTRCAIVLACVVWAVGEAIGYAVGTGSAEERMLEYELHKARYV